ncbi:amino acid ABC transporter permease [Falsibacillus pallidus]|uniref:L-arginine ABC transporter membrane protein n=1 Tax=Falsibacillus pallidus TaxID=493781 RepID=A0A370GBX2_9BACI|nr:amino acid ABC transporter permease [Falsibacillus pallidus]RDI41221.1 L-arginine ABC transporter membrane protein [Falsibacillus pallidus]
MGLDFQQLIPSVPFILKGIGVTLKIVLLAGVIGFLFGIILALFKISKLKVLGIIADVYTSIFRGTPLVLQLMIIFYGSPQIFGTQIDPYTAAVSAFAMNSAAYISEIIRAGIQAVDKGQQEAAAALGISYKQMMKDIILPQALKNILPALMNEFITLTKESAIVTVIGVTDVMRRSYMVGSDLYSFFEPLLFAGLVYYLLVIILTVLGKAVERRMRVSD